MLTGPPPSGIFLFLATSSIVLIDDLKMSFSKSPEMPKDVDKSNLAMKIASIPLTSHILFISSTASLVSIKRIQTIFFHRYFYIPLTLHST